MRLSVLKLAVIGAAVMIGAAPSYAYRPGFSLHAGTNRSANQFRAFQCKSSSCSANHPRAPGAHPPPPAASR